MSLSTPKAPDPYVTADAQSKANSQSIAQAARFNRTNQVTPFGRQTYSGTPGELDDTLTTTLTPETQKLLDGQTQISQGLTDLSNERLFGIPREGFQAPTDPNSFLDPRANQTIQQLDPRANQTIQQLDPRANQQLQTSYDTRQNDLLDPRANQELRTEIGDAGEIQRGVDGAGPIMRTFGMSGPIQASVGGADAGTRQSVEDALYQRATSRLDPRFQQDEQALDTRLANQGITLGSDAYTRAKSDFSRNKDDAYSAAINDAIAGGGAEQSRLFGLGLQQGEFSNQAQAQDFGQQLTRGNFYNSGQGQQFGQGVESGRFVNDAQGQQYAQLADRARFYNDAEGQQFGQGMQLMGYNMAANEANNANNANKAAFANQASGQQFDQGMGVMDYNARASGQNFNQGMDLSRYNAAASGQNFNQGMQLQNYNQQEYQRQLANELQGRNQNFNELAAFLNGSPISPNNPTFQTTAQYSPQGVPIGDYIQGNYQSQMQGRNSLISSLLGGASQLGSAAILCWVAREVYGSTNPRWLAMRTWMRTKAPEAIREFYLKHGPAIADFISDKPEWKQRIHQAMEECLV